MNVTSNLDARLLGAYINQTKMGEVKKQEEKQSTTATNSNSTAVVLNFSKSALEMMQTKTASVNAYAAKAANSVLKVGSKGSEVTTLQKNLTSLGYDTKGTDGILGNDTKNAVIAFQKAYSLTADGIVGSATQDKITYALNNKKNGILTVGSRGSEVTTLQKNLTSLGYNTKGTDGIFGNDTKTAVMNFQRAKGLTVDGIVGSNTQKAIANALNQNANPVTPTPTGNLTAAQQKMITNLQNDTSLGLSSSKKTAMVYAAQRMFSDGYEVAFVAGMLGNIKNEGTPGKFESSAYISNPSAEPSYLVYMDNNYDYRNKYSGKTITSVGVDQAINLQNKVVQSGYKGKFGLGMIQWTGERTTGLLQAYKKYCYICIYSKIISTEYILVSSNYPSEAEMAKAEVNYMADELKGDYASVYKNWKNGSKTAKSAGEIICKEYERPKDSASKAITRGNDATAIYNVLMK